MRTKATATPSRILLLALVLAALPASGLAGQDVLTTVRVRVEADGAPVAGAEVRAGRVVGSTDDAGVVVLRLPPGRHTVSVFRPGYARETARVDVVAGREVEVVVGLEEAAVRLDGIVVHSTRTDRRIDEEPIRVEVVDREEIEEKMLMTPGDISMLLNETGGLRVQVTSPSLGGANVRVHGLRGRYTQILSDGLPLYGGQTGGLGMLQIPPMDLAQVEVIKGAASALYGASAMGGVVNLISRRPDDELELLVNQTTRGGTDGVAWAAGTPGDRWGYTLLGGVHRQSKHDVAGDGWADLPGYRRAVLRPRLFWDDGAGRSLFVTAAGTFEDREGGTLEGATTPAGTPYTETLDTRRVDGGLVGRILIGDDRLLSVRASAMAQRHRHRFGDAVERDLHGTAFGEVALRGTDGRHTWVAGVALQRDTYRARDVDGFDRTETFSSVFLQDEITLGRWAAVAASGRLDVHREHGPLFSPRVSLLVGPGGDWSTRLSVGAGYFAPTPWTDDTEAVGLRHLEPLDDLAVERARSASLDLGRNVGPLELNVTAFGSHIRNALLLRRQDAGRLALVNATLPTRTWGTDLLVRFHDEPLHLTATYTYTRSTEQDPATGQRREVPLTPRHAAGAVGMFEWEESGRLGVELYYVGRQQLDDNPYRRVSRPHVITGVLGELRVGRARVFLNAENLLDTRLTRHHPLLLPARTAEGRWTPDVWAPLEGRTFNAGIRLGL